MVVCLYSQYFRGKTIRGATEEVRRSVESLLQDQKHQLQTSRLEFPLGDLISRKIMLA